VENDNNENQYGRHKGVTEPVKGEKLKVFRNKIEKNKYREPTYHLKCTTSLDKKKNSVNNVRYYGDIYNILNAYSSEYF